MQTLRCFLPIFFLVISFGLPKQDLFAGPGDTTIIRTFTFNTPESPKDGWFEFPSDSMDYEKILMYYTQKCDPSQNPPCAEFCPKQHYVKVNGVTHWGWQIIQECADTPLYPQGGTWIYDRAVCRETRNCLATPRF